MTCTGAYSDANDFSTFWCVDIPEDEEAEINRMLQLSATSIHAARAATGGCDCTLSDWATDCLKMLNCMLAVAVFNCQCSNLNLPREQKEMYMNATREDLTLIRTGQIELCAGATGLEYPAFGIAEYSFTEYNTARMILNRMLKDS